MNDIVETNKLKTISNWVCIGDLAGFFDFTKKKTTTKMFIFKQ